MNYAAFLNQARATGATDVVAEVSDRAGSRQCMRLIMRRDGQGPIELDEAHRPGAEALDKLVSQATVSAEDAIRRDRGGSFKFSLPELEVAGQFERTTAGYSLSFRLLPGPKATRSVIDRIARAGRPAPKG